MIGRGVPSAQPNDQLQAVEVEIREGFDAALESRSGDHGQVREQQ
jgi:hypothetical protein